MLQTIDELQKAFDSLSSPSVEVHDIPSANDIIDELVYTAVFSQKPEVLTQARQFVRDLAKQNDIISSSINTLYRAIGKEGGERFTVPAINVRALTYDTARCVFRLMNQYMIGPVIFEIARSEMDYTLQRPDEYSTVILGAALREKYHGPVFIQGDHFQLSARKFAADAQTEIQKIKDLAKEAISAQFYNIDIDASTLVDLSKENLDEQQKNNYEITAELTKYIRTLQPQGTIISIGGEIGHIGDRNSTPEDFQAFMKGYTNLVNEEGISKVSVQTGTSHGGTPDASGKILDVKLDFSVLGSIGKIAREQYGMGGAVQHGASTLPNDLFNKFPEYHTLEIHLATGFQNIVYDHLPQDVKDKMYEWCKQNLQAERKADWTDEQFVYKTRKKAIGPFKQQLWDLSPEQKQPIIAALEAQLTLLFKELNVVNTKDLVSKYY